MDQVSDEASSSSLFFGFGVFFHSITLYLYVQSPIHQETLSPYVALPIFSGSVANNLNRGLLLCLLCVAAAFLFIYILFSERKEEKSTMKEK